MISRFNTLQGRFTLWTTGLLISALIIFGAFVYIIMASELARAVDDSLQLSAAQAIAAAVDNGQMSVSDSVPEPSAITSLHDRGFTIRILRLDGTPLKSVGEYRNLSADGASLAAARARSVKFETVIDLSLQEAVRFYTVPVIIDDQVMAIVQVGQSLDSMNDTLEKLLTALLISIPLLVMLAAGGGYLLVTRALLPIDAITRTAQRISAHDLHERLNLPPTEDEVGRLAATFDTMLGRLETSFQRERQFTADASHELRTPLTAMQTIISVIREKRRAPEQYERALDDLANEAGRLRELVEDLLHLARKDTGNIGLTKSVDLSTMLHDVAEVMCPLTQAKKLNFTCEVPDNIQVVGNSDDLVRLFINLVDNAVKYTDRGKVNIRTRRDDTHIQITIADTGIGIDPEHVLHLFDRFYRAESSRSIQGNGLGLSIALAIVEAHRGEIRVSSELGRGSTFTVELPVDLPTT